MFGGHIWGIVGMILATPITAVLKTLMLGSELRAPGGAHEAVWPRVGRWSWSKGGRCDLRGAGAGCPARTPAELAKSSYSGQLEQGGPAAATGEIRSWACACGWWSLQDVIAVPPERRTRATACAAGGGRRPRLADGTHDDLRWVTAELLLELAPLDVPLVEEAIAFLAAPDDHLRSPRPPPVLDGGYGLPAGRSLRTARGRFLAADVRIDGDQPGFDRATMDGTPWSAAIGQFDVVATVPREPPTRELWALASRSGSTGAPALAGGRARGRTAALARRGAGTARRAPLPGKSIAWRGEDARQGDTLVARGTRLAPAHLSVAAMAGAVEVEVFQRPRVSVVTTGDEVGAAGKAGIRDSNGPLLDALMASLEVEVTRRHARDQEGELRAALEAAAADADVVVTTGGVSMGERDLVPATLSSSGTRPSSKVRSNPVSRCSWQARTARSSSASPAIP